MKRFVMLLSSVVLLSACAMQKPSGGEEGGAPSAHTSCEDVEGATFSFAQLAVQKTVDCHYSDGDMKDYGPVCETTGGDWRTISESDVGYEFECSTSREDCTFECRMPAPDAQ